MKQLISQTENKQFWQERALNKGFNSKSVTDADVYRRELEITSIIPYIPSNSVGIDIGCGSAYGTDEFSKYCEHIVCSDFSENMIELAKQDHSTNPKLSFVVENVIEPAEDTREYDFAIVQRCLINILSKEDQKQSINNIYNRLKPGGLFIMLEGYKEGRDKLDQLRAEAGLEKMPSVQFNLDFEKEELLNFTNDKFDLISEEYLGLYDYVSRVVYPLSIQPEQPKYESKTNEYLYNFILNNSEQKEKFQECSRTFLFVFKKK